MGQLSNPQFGGVIQRTVVTLLAAGTLAVGLLLVGTVHGQATAGASAACSSTSQLAYAAAKYSGEKAMIWLANANGSHRRKLLRAADPVLSPNGEMVAVSNFDGSAGLGVFTACGGLISRFFSSHDTITGITWSPDSSIVAAVVAANPEQAPFKERLELIEVATGRVTKVATGFLSGWGGPTFSPTSSHQLAYANVTKVGRNPNIWSVKLGHPSVQLTRHDTNQYPVWGPRGLLYQHALNDGKSYLHLFAGGHSSTLMKLQAWPVAVSSDGTRLAAESAACGVVWPVSVNLSTRKVVHQFPTSFAPYGISPSGSSILISGSRPSGDCGGPRSVIETVPFSGGKPRFVADGTDPSWADSRAVGVQP
jgi:Tol biopolymer transport system component